LAQAKKPLKDAAAVNATRWATGNALKSFGIPVRFSSGGRTQYNRSIQGYSKDHWIDAACVGDTGECVRIPTNMTPLHLTATGRGSRQMCRVDRYGFPRTSAKRFKRVKGFQTGDMEKQWSLQERKQESMWVECPCVHQEVSTSQQKMEPFKELATSTADCFNVWMDISILSL
jgi:hypothetical protein